MTDFDTRYLALAHALQTGAQATFELDQLAIAGGEMSRTQPETSPKMLRTGVNMAMCEMAAIAHLLIGKGIITEDEYQTAILIKLEADVESYEQKLSERMGQPVRCRL